MAERGLSIRWVVIASMLLIALFGWGFMAGSFAGAMAKPYSEWTQADLDAADSLRNLPNKDNRVAFVSTAIAQLPNLPTVVSWHFRNRIWLPLLIVALEVGVLMGGVALKRVEKDLHMPRRRR
jgi:hypothetical protein